MKRLIYPAARAVEHAVAQPGVRPLRLFAVLWPLWQVETSADIYDEQQYEVIDHFIVRAILEAAIHSRGELLRFLSLTPSIVDRCLEFLGLIGHVRRDGDRLDLTGLGLRSAQAGVRYVPKESRQTLLVERQTGQPLTRPYYDGTTVLATPEIEDGQVADRTRFLRFFSTVAFNPGIVTWLENHPDRADYNLPSQLRDLRQLGVRDGYLPVYLIETADHGVLAYSNIGEQRDTFFESVCQQVAVHDLIEAEGVRDPQEVWTDWLARSAHGAGVLRRLSNGVWRIALAPAAFGGQDGMSVSRIGSYLFQEHHFLQVWCDDEQVRERAVRERALGVASLPGVETRVELEQRVARLAATLKVHAPDLADLQRYARQSKDHRLHHLEMLKS